MDTIITLIICLAPLAGLYKMFEKAGVPGWKGIVPIYNMVVWLELTERPLWWLAMVMLVPFANIYFMFMMMNDMAKAFGKGTGFAVGMFFLPFVFFPMLGFMKDATFTKPHRLAAPVVAA